MYLFPTLFQILSHTVVTPDLIAQNLYLILFIFHNFSDEKLPIAYLTDSSSREIIALREYPCFSPAPKTEGQGAEVAVLGIRYLFVFYFAAVALTFLLVGRRRIGLG